MVKVLLITPRIPFYRLEVYQQLGQLYKLTVLHSGKNYLEEAISFSELIIPIRKLGPFTFFFKDLNKICKNYEVIISESNIRHIDRDILILNPSRNYRWISWGIGVSSSYNKRYDSDQSLDWLRRFVFLRADANVFYSEYPIEKCIKAGFPRESLFVAHNTVHVIYNTHVQYQKSKVLFIGTLYKQKKIYDLLNSYKKACSMVGNFVPLDIIGEGPEYLPIKEWIASNKMHSRISLRGPIYNDMELERHFREAYACISPGQAGLSVLSSMGYGTPFITKYDAITGGEIFNINNGKNGVLYKNNDDLTSILIDIMKNPIRYIEMGNEARQYYNEHRQVSHMVKGLSDSIDYVMRKT